MPKAAKCRNPDIYAKFRVQCERRENVLCLFLDHLPNTICFHINTITK